MARKQTTIVIDSREEQADRRRIIRAERRHWAWLSYLETYYRFRGMKNQLKQTRVP